MPVADVEQTCALALDRPVQGQAVLSVRAWDALMAEISKPANDNRRPETIASHAP